MRSSVRIRLQMPDHVTFVAKLDKALCLCAMPEKAMLMPIAESERSGVRISPEVHLFFASSSMRYFVSVVHVGGRVGRWRSLLPYGSANGIHRCRAPDSDPNKQVMSTTNFFHSQVQYCFNRVLIVVLDNNFYIFYTTSLVDYFGPDRRCQHASKSLVMSKRWTSVSPKH